MSDGERLKKAQATSEYAHANQFRKGSSVPYYTHPKAVAEISSRYTNSEDAVVAAYLHDVLEDVPSERYSEKQMLADFGKRVVEIVERTSENKRADEVAKPWEERKKYYLSHLEGLEDQDALIVSVADKIHNIDAMLADYQQVGEDLWEKFNAPKEKQLWYYEEINRIVSQKPVPEEMKKTLSEKIAKLADIIKQN
ncbi:MAG: HD domain-containing protein [Candidatus Nomurabacteria bacterium]|jgi:(p)ppGpp synthase/HD superfamily hydrolase|nr:HD domain-containing protein [Candidatus Nomurabacteria bacterium]